MNYLNIRMPGYFLSLLKSNMSTKGTFVRDITTFIYHYPSFGGLVKKYFADIDSEIRIDIIIKSMGWENFRNRMALIFLNYEKYGEYVTDLDESLLDDLIKFEKQVMSYITTDNSRAFLLSFYKKLSEIRISKIDNVDGYDLSRVDNQIIELLEYSSAKILKVDIILLILELLQNELGAARIKKALVEKESFSCLYAEMEFSQREKLTKNLLSYGQSINEIDLFVNDTV